MAINTWPIKEESFVFSPLSKYWTYESCKKPRCVVVLPIIYVSGMISHVVTLPIRIVFFAYEFFRLLFTPIESLYRDNGVGFQDKMKKRALCLSASFGEIFTCVIGILCPPAAYDLEKRMYDNETIQSNAPFFGRRVKARDNDDNRGPFPVLDIPFDDEFEVWDEGIENRNQPAPDLNDTNGIRIAKKKAYLEREGLLSGYQNAIIFLLRYYTKEGIGAGFLETFNQVNLIGLLFVQEETRDNKFFQPFDAYCKEEYHKNGDVLKPLGAFQIDWDNKPIAPDTIARLKRFALREAFGKPKDGVEFLKDPGQKSVWGDCKLSAEEQELYDAIVLVNNAIILSDNELLGIIGTLLKQYAR